MTHSHDRTLLASLGFSDPDKREQLHDLACEYLTETERAIRLVRIANPPETGPISVRTILESEISKGEGQYRTTIGFLDLRIDWIGETRKGVVLVEVKILSVSIGDILRQIALYRGYLAASGGGSVYAQSSLSTETFAARLRAMSDASGPKKSGPIDTGMSWVLASVFKPVSGQLQTLREANIAHVHLGEGFTKWFEERCKQPVPKLEEF